MTSDLTERQKSVLDYIVAYQQKHQMAPTVREIGAHLGLRSPAGTHRLLHVLKDKGYITAESGKKRSWRFSGELPGRGLPLIGYIAAGTPIEAVENIREKLSIPPSLFGSDACFGLKVADDSMVEAHILDGDVAVIHPQKRVENGEIGAVIVQDLLPEATLKVIRRTRTMLKLLPANPAYDRLVFKGPQRQNVRILGKFVGIIRKT